MSDFHIIPVIDIMDGLAVHARRGQRDGYRPVQSILSPDSVPEHLVRGLLDHHPFASIYVADLDAIRGKGAQTSVIAPLTRHADIWLDQGVSSPGQAQALTDVTVVVGSESLPDLETWLAIKAKIADAGLVLSLDFDPAGGFKGPPALWSGAGDWPSRAIVMTLDRVGSGGGPDMARLRQAQEKSPQTVLYAAGGVRGEADIRALAAQGIGGALVATALHDGTLRLP